MWSSIGRVCCGCGNVGAALGQLSAVLGGVALGPCSQGGHDGPHCNGYLSPATPPGSFSDSLRKGQSSFFPSYPEHLVSLPALLPRRGLAWTPASQPQPKSRQADRQQGTLPRGV